MKTSFKIIIGTCIFLVASISFAYEVTCSAKGVNSASFTSSGLFSFNAEATAQTGIVELTKALGKAKKLVAGGEVECIMRTSGKPVGYLYFTVISGTSRTTTGAGIILVPDPATIKVIWP